MNESAIFARGAEVRATNKLTLVMAQLDRAIQEQKTHIFQYDFDGRVKPGHDMMCFRERNCPDFCPSHQFSEWGQKMQSILGRFKVRILRAQRDERGAAMIEFAIIALPFLGLLLGMLEVGLIFWGGYELDNATLAASRLIKTGQAQKNGYGQADIVTQICNNVAILSGCASSLTLTVQTVSSFACVANPSQSGCTETASGDYKPGQGSQIELVTASYEWPLFNFATVALLANLPDGNRLITSTAVFQNEPF